MLRNELDPKNPAHARLLAIKEENRELIRGLAEYGQQISPAHVLDVRFALLLEQVFPGKTSKARVEYETRFEAFMHEEMENDLATCRRLGPPPATPPVPLPVELANLRDMAHVVRRVHELKGQSQ